MLRLNVVLALVLVACALSVVTARHQARKLFVELQGAEKQSRQLDIEWGRLQLEQSTWAMHARVEQVAGKHLQMAVPDISRVRVLNAGGGQP
jgi:cell division protein FtsL